MSLTIGANSIPKDKYNLISKYCVITPKDPNQYKKKGSAKKILTPVNFYHFDEKSGDVSLPLFFAKKILQFENTKEYPQLPVCIPSIQLRKYQEEFFDKALSIFRKSGFLTLKAYAGFGKTAMCALLSGFARRVTAILLHRRTLISQWVNSFIKAYPQFENHILIVGEKSSLAIGEVWLIICMVGQYEKIEPELVTRVGTLILDEAHCLSTEGSISAILHFHPKNIIVATATLERKDGMERMMHALAGTEGVFCINKNPYTLIRFNTNIDFDPGENSYGMDFGNLLKLQADSEERNAMIIPIIKLNPNRKFMILVKLQQHVKELERILRREKIECDTLFGSKTSYSDSHVLVGSIPKIGTGFDEENFCQDFKGKKSDVLILLSSISCKFSKKNFEEKQNVSEIALYEQVRGRIMRATNPTVIYFVDNVGAVVNHFNGAKRLADYTNGRVLEFSYSEESIKEFTIPEPPPSEEKESKKKKLEDIFNDSIED